MIPRRFRPKIVPKNCIFCKTDTEPNLNGYGELGRYISERGKILSHMRTGICSKHQKRMARVVKHARYLALMPYVERI